MSTHDPAMAQREAVARLIRSNREVSGLTVVDAVVRSKSLSFDGRGISRTKWTEIEQAAPLPKAETLSLAARTVNAPLIQVFDAAGYEDAAAAARSRVSSPGVAIEDRVELLTQVLRYLLREHAMGGADVPPELLAAVEGAS